MESRARREVAQRILCEKLLDNSNNILHFRYYVRTMQSEQTAKASPILPPSTSNKDRRKQKNSTT